MLSFWKCMVLGLFSENEFKGCKLACFEGSASKTPPPVQL